MRYIISKEHESFILSIKLHKCITTSWFWHYKMFQCLLLKAVQMMNSSKDIKLKVSNFIESQRILSSTSTLAGSTGHAVVISCESFSSMHILALT